jgi:hypothetical protein
LNEHPGRIQAVFVEPIKALAEYLGSKPWKNVCAAAQLLSNLWKSEKKNS